MALSTANARNEIIAGLGGGADRIVIDKASLSNAVAGQLFSLWQAGGIPGAGATPSAAAICTKALTGALGFTNQTAPATSYMGWLWHSFGNGNSGVEWHDRVAHMGGLSGTVITAQGALALTGLSAERLGATDYSDVQWWLEVYTALGATGVNATVAVVYDDDSTGNLAAIALGATPRAGRLYPLVSAVAGRFIKSITNVTLSATTGTAGNFGITATRQKCAVAADAAFKPVIFDWAQLGCPLIPNDSCMQMIMQCSTTSTGVVRGSGKIIHA